MAVTAQTPYKSFTAAPGATLFSSEFRVIQASDLVVRVNGSVITSGFTVAGLGNTAGVDVTFTAPMAGGELVELLREVPLTRATDYQSVGDFLSAVVNIDFDRIWHAMQGLSARLGGVLRAPYPEQINQLPSAAARANRYLAFNGSGEPVAVDGTSSDVVVTPFAQGLLDDTTEDAAQTTLGGSTVGKAVFTAADQADARAAIGAAQAATSVPTSRTISPGGLATGGGDLSANRTITVTAASQAQAEAGTDTATAMTPQRTAQALTAQLPAANAALAAGSVGTYAFCQQVTGTAAIGDTVAGSNLRYTDRSGGTNTVTIPSGTWRCMGNNSVNDRGTVWLRIA